MKVRIYSPHYPFPVTEGAFQTIMDQARSISELGHSVELVTWKDKDSPSAQFTTGIRHIYWKASHGPMSGAPVRALRSLISDFASSELHYYPLGSDRRAELAEADVGIYHYSFAYPWLKQRDAPEKRRIVHFHNLESDLFKERAALASNLSRVVHRNNARLLSRHESDLANIADELWFVSPLDYAQYRGKGRARKRLVSPTYDARDFRKFELGRAPSSGLILGFIGKLDFGPNFSSLDWILKEVCPYLAASGFSGELRVAGKGSPAELVEQAAKFPFIRLLGYLQNPGSFWNELDLMLVPHITGSGVRMKLLEALARGIPTLVNSEAALRVMPETRVSEGLLVNDSGRDWANLIISESEEIRKLRDRGFEFPAGLDGRHIYHEIL